MRKDTIYRQAAIDALVKAIRNDPYYDSNERINGLGLCDVRVILNDLPSAQPEKVKCKKCRYVYYDKEFGNYWCNRMSGSFMVEEDGYCKWGK